MYVSRCETTYYRHRMHYNVLIMSLPGYDKYMYIRMLRHTHVIIHNIIVSMHPNRANNNCQEDYENKMCCGGNPWVVE